MKMADMNQTCENLLERASVSSSVDHLCFEQVRQPPAHLPPCINISPDFSLKRQDLLPQKSGFVAAEIWICRLRNQILWRRECQRHSGGGIFSAFTAAWPCLSLQNSFPINARNENKGRNITAGRFNQAPLKIDK